MVEANFSQVSDLPVWVPSQSQRQRQREKESLGYGRKQLPTARGEGACHEDVKRRAGRRRVEMK